MPTWTFNLLTVCLEQFVLNTVETDLVSKVYDISDSVFDRDILEDISKTPVIPSYIPESVVSMMESDDMDTDEDSISEPILVNVSRELLLAGGVAEAIVSTFCEKLTESLIGSCLRQVLDISSVCAGIWIDWLDTVELQ